MDRETSTRATVSDPEFGSYHSGPILGGLDREAEGYLRLVANPFLSFLYLTAWLFAMYETVAVGFAGPLTPMLLAMLIAGLWFTPQLLQFHCLDCGASGRLLRWRKHLCARVVQRIDSGQPRRIRGPSPPLQVVLWIWIMLAMAMVANALRFP